MEQNKLPSLGIDHFFTKAISCTLRCWTRNPPNEGISSGTTVEELHLRYFPFLYTVELYEKLLHKRIKQKRFSMK